MSDKQIILEILRANGGQLCPQLLREEAAKRGINKRDFERGLQSLLSWDEVGLGPLLTIALPDTKGVTFNFY